MSVEWMTFLYTYTVIILCELGDKTQLAVLLITSNNPTKKWLVFSASALALVTCVVIEVTIGVTLAKHIGPASINRVAGFIFLVIGVIILATHFKVAEKIGLLRKDVKKVAADENI